MGNSLSSVKNYDASELACPWFVCMRCGVVDRDRQRIRTDYECTNCGQQAGTARLYFPITIHILVDLVHQAYHSSAPVGPIDGPQTRAVGTVVFFCALREALLVHFLGEHMAAQKLPDEIAARLLDDNKLASQRFGQLFKSVVGVSWREAVQRISNQCHEFLSVSELMKRASETRNEFMHNGRAWSITEELATECVDSLPSLTRLFASLHNEYIAPRLNPHSAG